jgi:hypothetical protein
MRVDLSFVYKPSLGHCTENPRVAYSLSPLKYVVTVCSAFLSVDRNSDDVTLRDERGNDALELVFQHDDAQARASLIVGVRGGRALCSGAMLCATAYATTHNELGAICVQRVGAAHFDVSHGIESALKGGIAMDGNRKKKRGAHGLVHEQTKGLQEFQSDVSKKKTNTEYLVEGTMTVRYAVEPPPVEGGRGVAVQRGGHERDGPAEWDKRMTALCERGFREVQGCGLEPTIRGVCPRVRCPEFMVPPDVTLPGGMYCLYGKPPPGSGFGEAGFRGLLLQALGVLGRTGDELASWVSSRASFLANHRDACLVVVQVVCRFAWSLQYISDFTNANHPTSPYRKGLVDDAWNETFKNTFRCRSGDCEDLAWSIYRLFCGLTDECDGFEDATLRSLGRLMRDHYVPVLPQCVASHANVREKMREWAKGGVAPSPTVSFDDISHYEDTGAKDMRRCFASRLSRSRDVMSHTLCLLVPKRRFRAWVLNGRAASDAIDPGRWGAISSALESMHPDGEGRADESVLHVLCCEGTYPTHPLHPSLLTEEENDAMGIATRVLCGDYDGDEDGCDMRDLVDSEKAIESSLEDRFCKMMVRGFTDCLHRHGLKSVNLCFVEKRSDGDRDTYGSWSESVLSPISEATTGCFFYCFMEDRDFAFAEGVFSREPSTKPFVVPSLRDLEARSVPYRSLLRAVASCPSLHPSDGGVGDKPCPPSFVWGRCHGGATRPTSFFVKGDHAPIRSARAIRALIDRCVRSGEHRGLRATFVPVFRVEGDGTRPGSRDIFVLRVDVYPNE